MILLLIIFITLFLAHGTYKLAFYCDRRNTDDPHRIPAGPKYDCLKDEIHRLISTTLSIPYEPVTITSRDGLKLFGKYYNTCMGAPVCLLMHGWHGIAERDFAAGVQIHINHGFNVLLVDQRAMGKSEGTSMTFGIKERFDCLDWTQFLIDRLGSDTQIIIHGVSMGGATVMMASGEKLPANIKGIISDSGYTSPKEIIIKVCNDKKAPGRLLWPFVYIGARIFGHFDPLETDARRAISQNTLPLMLIHGTGDDFVPCAMSRELYTLTKGPRFMVETPGAPHVLAYMYDNKAYLDCIEQFYSKCFA